MFNVCVRALVFTLRMVFLWELWVQKCMVLLRWHMRLLYNWGWGCGLKRQTPHFALLHLSVSGEPCWNWLICHGLLFPAMCSIALPVYARLYNTCTGVEAAISLYQSLCVDFSVCLWLLLDGSQRSSQHGQQTNAVQGQAGSQVSTLADIRKHETDHTHLDPFSA